MNKPNFLNQLNYRLILILTIITGVNFSAQNAIAHDHVSVLFQPPPEDEQPEKTEGAASRQTHTCTADAQLASASVLDEQVPLTAIAPQSNYGLTTLERPNFWVYLPPSSAKQAILSIKREGKTPHWQQSVELTGKAGVIGIQLAEQAPILELNSNYQWAVILLCNERPHPNDPVVTSWIRRVARKNPASSTSISSLEQISSYAQAGIWYDALNILISSQSSQANWRNLWSEYLKSAGLDEIADLPVRKNVLLPKL